MTLGERARAGPALAVLTTFALLAAVCAVARADFRQADRQRALEIGLRLADVGTGWVEITGGKSPRTVDAGTLVGQSVTADCGADPATAKTGTNLIVTGGSMSSFTTPRQTPSLVSLVMLFKTAFLARKEVGAVHDLASLRPCLESQLRKALGGLTPGATVALLRFSAPSLAGAYRIATRLPGGARPRIYLDLLVTRRGRGVVETVVLSIDSLPPAAVEQRAAAVSARRLARYSD